MPYSYQDFKNCKTVVSVADEADYPKLTMFTAYPLVKLVGDIHGFGVMIKDNDGKERVYDPSCFKPEIIEKQNQSSTFQVEPESQVAIVYDTYNGQKGTYAIIHKANLWQRIGDEEYDIDLRNQQDYVKQVICNHGGFSHAFYSISQAVDFDSL